MNGKYYITLKILANLSAWLLPAIGSVALRRILPVPRSRTPRTSTLTSRRLPSVVVVPNQNVVKKFIFYPKKTIFNTASRSWTILCEIFPIWIPIVLIWETSRNKSKKHSVTFHCKNKLLKILQILGFQPSISKVFLIH